MSARKADPMIARIQAHLYAVNAVQAERIGLTAMAIRMWRLADGASPDRKPTEREPS